MLSSSRWVAWGFTIRDVRIGEVRVVLRLRSSKTDQAGEGSECAAVHAAWFPGLPGEDSEGVLGSPP